MVAGSKASQRGLQFKRCGRARRAAVPPGTRPAALPPLVLLGVLAILASVSCGLGSPAAGTSPRPSPKTGPSASPSAAPSPAVAASYWVLATLGLRIHQAPDPAATVVTVIRPGAQLDTTGSSVIGGTTWVHVHAHSSPDLDGWAVDDPLLLTDVPMQGHDDTTLGYSLLFPASWTYTAGGASAAIFSSPDGSQRLTVEAADSLDHLPPEPTAPGKADHQEGPLDVYGKSPLLTYYRLDAGGYELDLSFLWATGRAFGFVFRAPSPDSSLLKQILASVIIR